MTATSYAKQYRVTRTTIQRWKKDGAPLANDALMADWLAGRHHSADGAQPTLAAARLRKVTREAALLGLRLDREKKDVVAKADVSNDMLRISGAMQQRLSFLIGEAPTWAGLEPHEIQARVKRFVNETHQLFSDMTNPLYKAA